MSTASVANLFRIVLSGEAHNERAQHISYLQVVLCIGVFSSLETFRVLIDRDL